MPSTTTIKIALIKADSISFISVEPTLAEFQALVGGYLEAWHIRQSTHIYFDEEGRIKNLPPNDLANRILPMMISSNKLIDGVPHENPPLPELVGPVLVVGSQEPTGQPDGDEHSISRRTALDLTLAWLGRPVMSRKDEWK